MSSRTGKIVTAEWVLDEVEKKITQLMEERQGEGAQLADVEQVIKSVSLAALKFAFLKSSIGKDIAFDFDNSLSFQGKSGPYILYSFVRGQKILKTAASHLGLTQQELEQAVAKNSLQALSDMSEQQQEVLRWLERYEEVIIHSAQQYAPHILCEYLHELCQRFNLWYSSTNVVSQIDKGQVLDEIADSTQLDLALVLAVCTTLNHGFSILSIPVVEQM